MWEKEIRRARKETFKAQSALVKVQEELKSSRTAQKAAEEQLQSERERCKALEQEALDARQNAASLQEQLSQALERVKALEQELDELKALAKKQEETRRIESEGNMPPSPSRTDAGENADESVVPRKRPRSPSLAGSSADEADVEALTLRWQWEKQRADRALEQIQFLEAECQLKICAAGKLLRRDSGSRRSSPRRKRGSHLKCTDAGDSMILSESGRASPEPSQPPAKRSKTDLLREDKESRRSTIFLPAEGIFRTVSQAEAEAMGAKASSSSSAQVSSAEMASSMPITPTDNDPMFRRTPSVDPPDFALLSKDRTSLLSLLNAPHRQDAAPPFNIPTTTMPESEIHRQDRDAFPTTRPSSIPPPEHSYYSSSLSGPLSDPLPSARSSAASAPPRPHSTASYYYPRTTTTTTKVPLRDEPREGDGPTLAQRLMRMQRTPSRAGGGGLADADAPLPLIDPDKMPSFDASNPALTPTMTREQALAQIRERRGRARSVGRGQQGQAQAAPGKAGAAEREDRDRTSGSSAGSAAASVKGFGGARRVRS